MNSSGELSEQGVSVPLGCFPTLDRPHYGWPSSWQGQRSQSGSKSLIQNSKVEGGAVGSMPPLTTLDTLESEWMPGLSRRLEPPHLPLAGF